ncbi:MAG: cytoplasmic protein [Pseudomonadota bacterium]|nr:cytoplasmic protein [Pseudomonadota bacterium]
MHRFAAVAGLAIFGMMALSAGVTASAQDAAKVDTKHYKVEFENDQVRILRINVGPHEKSVMHSHPAGVVVFLTDGHFKFTVPGGKTEDATVKAGTVRWSDAVTHLGENLGDNATEVIQVELKSKAAAAK